MSGILGRKLGMTSIFDSEGRSIAVTVIEAGPCVVTQVRTTEVDGYSAIQLGFGEAKAKNTSKALMGHFGKASTTPKRMVAEFDFKSKNSTYTLGQEITADRFTENEQIAVIGTSTGQGFQGVVKRHNFAGVGGQTHGQHNRLRAPGSMGASSFPSRVFKGQRMAGRTGGERIKVRGLKIIKIIAEKNLILVGGAVPGDKGAYVRIESKKQ